MAAAATMMADQTLDSRVARLESDVAHIRSDVAEMKLDIRELRKEVSAIDRSLRAEIGGVREQVQKLEAALEQKLTKGIASTRIWTLLQSAALLAVMARGFKWL